MDALRTSSRVARLVLAVIPFFPASGTWGAAPIAPSEQHPVEQACDEARRLLDGLVEGSIAEVWEIVEAGDLPALRFAPCRDDLVEKLTQAISRKDDDRVVARILAEIDFAEAQALLPVVRAALRHGSPEVRRFALRAVASSPDPLYAPEVEARFELERDARARQELIRALAATGSRRYLSELRELARSDDAPVRRAATQAVLTLPDAASVPFLAELASAPQEGDLELAGRIASALSSWSDVQGVEEALVRIGQDAPEQVAQQAIGGLAQRGTEAVLALAAIADARTRRGNAGLAEQAQIAMHSLRIEHMETITVSCARTGAPLRDLPLASTEGGELSDASVMVVSPEGGSATARCWDAPGFMWPQDIRPRVPAAVQLTIFDEFSWGEERWFATLSGEHLCWMREADLAADVVERGANNVAGAVEFDLPVAELNSWAAATLERRGWLRLLSADATVAALSLAIEEPTKQAAAALIGIRRGTDAPGLVAAIDAWLRTSSSWPDDDK